MSFPSLLACLILALAMTLSTPNAIAKGARGSYVRMEQPVATDNHLSRILFVNRCADGCVITPGPEDAIANTSGIVSSTTTLQPFPYGDAVWDEMLACVRQQYSRFDINVTDVDPGDVPHFESIVAGRGEDIGAGGVGGIAPFSCGVWGNSINFTFPETIGGSAQELCEVVAQESGHVMGMEHAYLCEDPMTYLSDCGPKEFQDIDAPCGEFSPVSCECGNTTQNSVQHLMQIFGPGNIPATAHLEILDVREDPDDSDGNAIFEPGESLVVEIAITNEGNFPSEDVAIKIKSGGHLRLRKRSEAIVVEPRQTITLELIAEVKPSACAKQVDFDVTTKLASGTWSDSASLRSGITASSWNSSIADDKPWSTDRGAGRPGAWEFGVPERTIFAGRTMQPDGSSAGPGTPVWMTGLKGRWDDNSVVGRSALVTSSIDLGDWHSVTGVEYRLWHLAFDRSRGGLDPSLLAHLTVEMSKNDGESWQQIDEVIGEEYRWDLREVIFDQPIESASALKFRFTVNNDDGVDERLIEIGVDGITLQGGELLCTPTNGGCGCSSSRSGAMGSVLWLLPLWLWLRRRRLSSLAS